MKNKKLDLFILIFVLCIGICLCLGYSYLKLKTNTLTDYLILALIIIVDLCIVNIIYNRNGKKNSRFKDKMFNSLVSDSNIVYIMMNSKTNEILYVSDNVEKVIGIKNEGKNNDEIVSDIFSIPIVKSELKNWNKTSEYISQMVEYVNPKYNYQMWIKIKIYSFKEKSNEYYVIQIFDATKEHERQHLLVTQASDIKARESQLNQITASSYDMEINLNLTSDSYNLKYFKLDNLYFGEERRGTYSSSINDIASKYINENDRELFLEKLSIDSLKSNFSRYELKSYSFRYRIGNEPKNNIWLESTVFFLSNRQSNRISILTKNVTESAESIRRQNVLLQNALNDAKMASNSKTELISAISHDVRTSLTNIMGLSDFLLNTELSVTVKEDIKNINDSTKEVIEIIDGLLDTSKIEKRIIEKEEKQYNIFKVFKNIEQNAKEYLEGKNIDVRLNLNSNLPVILYGDSKRISQAVTQVVNNSVKYTDEGIININVRGEKKDSDVILIIEISDTGLGMTEKKLNSIMMSSDSNTGIGSVKNLIKILDGTFEIESKINEYTKVTLSFKQKIVEDNKVRELMNSNKTTENFSLKGKKVLVVDDNKLNLKVTKRLLEAFELEVMLLESGEECLDLVNDENKFDLILLDQMMPGLDGTSTLLKLKENPNFHTPVVALTADAIQGQKERYLSSGFDDYVSKPIDKKELSRVLKRFLKEQ